MDKKIAIVPLLFVLGIILYFNLIQKQENKIDSDVEVDTPTATPTLFQEPIIRDEEDVKPEFPAIYETKGSTQAKVVLEKPSIYGNIVVFDNGEVRCIVIAGLNQSCWLFGQRPISGYVARMGKVVRGEVAADGKTLVIGMGGGTLLKYLKGVDFNIDVVEINEELDEVARKYFAIPENLNFEITYDDGRHFLNNTEVRYDVVAVDVCDINSYNSHLRTVKFWEEVENKLANSDRGVVIASLNIAIDDEDSETIQNMVANSMGSSFNNLYVSQPLEDKEGELDVLSFVATNRTFTSEEKAKYSLVEWNFDDSYGTITDSNTTEAEILDESANNSLRRQMIRNYGTDFLLPR
jgi:spermidine synthase